MLGKSVEKLLVKQVQKDQEDFQQAKNQFDYENQQFNQQFLKMKAANFAFLRKTKKDLEHFLK